MVIIGGVTSNDAGTFVDVNVVTTEINFVMSASLDNFSCLAAFDSR